MRITEKYHLSGPAPPRSVADWSRRWAPALPRASEALSPRSAVAEKALIWQIRPGDSGCFCPDYMNRTRFGLAIPVTEARGAVGVRPATGQNKGVLRTGHVADETDFAPGIWVVLLKESGR